MCVDLRKIAKALGRVAAEALSCEAEGDPIEAKDVSVEIVEIGPADLTDHAFEITVDAEYTWSRMANVTERTDKISQSLQSYLPAGMDGFVWVRLLPGSYVEFAVPPAP